jgi:hypothetical protein
MDIVWHDIVGTYGVFCIVFAYLMIQIEKWGSAQLRFSIVNGLGSILIIISLYFEWNWSGFLIEFFWALISLFGIFLYLRRPKNERRF